MSVHPVRPGVALAGGAVVLGLVLAGCGGGSAGSPRSLSLGGVALATSDVEQQLSGLCPVLAQARTDPGGAEAPFYRGPHGVLHQLTAVLAGGHRAQADALLKTMLAFEQDLTARSATAAGTDANALLGSVNDLSLIHI